MPYIRSMNSVILALLINNLAPGAVSPHALAAEILLVAEEYDVNPETVARIIIIESRGLEHAYNKRTNDHGLMQLNGRTMQLYGISMHCAMSWRCNLHTGALILSHTKRVCQYNVGTAPLKGTLLKNCLKYERKLANL